MTNTKTLFESFEEDVIAYKQKSKYAPTRVRITKNVIDAYYKDKLTKEEASKILDSLKGA